MQQSHFGKIMLLVQYKGDRIGQVGD